MSSLEPGFTLGTHRLVAPEETLRFISPRLKSCGITRCADVTRLDDLGIPTYCAIRPAGRVLQISNGKGLTAESAKVSALMESLELHHAENPDPRRLRQTSRGQLLAEGERALHPGALQGWRDGYFADDFQVEWTAGVDAVSGRRWWVPASAVYFGRQPSLNVTTTNGLASGNHLVEAKLHAVYELLERHVVSGLSVGGKLQIERNSHAIALDSVEDESLAGLIDRIASAGSKMLLLWIPGEIRVHTFWALLLSEHPIDGRKSVHFGYGTHLHPVIAACRAVTESAQSRLTMIHGAREDIVAKHSHREGAPPDNRVFEYFDKLKAELTWSSLAGRGEFSDFELRRAYQFLIDELTTAGREVLSFDLTDEKLQVPVVKVVVPGLRFNRRMF